MLCEDGSYKAEIDWVRITACRRNLDCLLGPGDRPRPLDLLHLADRVIRLRRRLSEPADVGLDLTE